MKLVAKEGSVYYHGRFYVPGEEIPAPLDDIKGLVADGIVSVIEEPAHEPEPTPVVAEAPVAPAEESPAAEKAKATPPPAKEKKTSPPVKKNAQRKPRATKS
jgi:hypothetical protein